MAIKNGDFIELEYTAKIVSNNTVFDTTNADVAKKHDLTKDNIEFKPFIICVGENQVIRGLDTFLFGKEPGSYNVKINAEDAFGKKNAKLLRLISIGEFHKHKIEPYPGLEVELDDSRGIVRTVNGGRIIVDFNHPLASQDVEYDIVIKKIVEDKKQQVEAVLDIFKIPHDAIEYTDGKITIPLKMALPQEYVKPISDEIVRLVGIKDILFKQPQSS